MKIIYIINARIPTEKAYGFQTISTCENFVKLGVELEMWRAVRDNNIKVSVFDFYKIKNKWHIEDINSYDFFRLKNILHIYLVVFLLDISFLLKVLFKKPDKSSIIYSLSPLIIWFYSLRGYKTCYECHDWFSKKYKTIALLSLRRCSHIITINSFVKNKFLENGFKPKFLVEPNGINLEFFDFDLSKDEAIKKLDNNDDLKRKLKGNHVLMYTGSLKTKGYEKGVDEILRAMTKLGEDFVFLAVGGSVEDSDYYKKRIKKYNISDRVFLIPRVDQRKLAIYQKAADVLLMPFPNLAHYEYYMSPMKTFEYMASKRPIIASSLPSIREILGEDMCIFCKPGDSNDLAEKIKFIAGNKNLSKKIAQKAYDKVVNHTWRKRAKRIMDFLS